MPPWAIRVSNTARKALRRIPDRDQLAIEAAIDGLAADPSRADIVKLTDARGEYRLRVGDYRVFFRFDPHAHVITVLDVRQRGGAYR